LSTSATEHRCGHQGIRIAPITFAQVTTDARDRRPGRTPTMWAPTTRGMPI